MHKTKLETIAAYFHLNSVEMDRISIMISMNRVNLRPIRRSLLIVDLME